MSDHKAPHTMDVKQELGLSDGGMGLAPTDSIDIARVTQSKKPFTTWSAMSLGFSISNTGMGMALVVGSAVFGAGPLFIYGTLLVTAVTFCVAITLGELASAYPHAGGQYYWTAQLSSPNTRRFISYMTAILSWASVICTGASAVSGMTNTIFAIVGLTYPDFNYQPWMGFLLFQAFNWAGVAMVFYERIIPVMSNTFVAVSLVTTITMIICLVAPNSRKASAAQVFGADGYFNLSGWSDGVAFLVGISGINWGFSCLDAATHLAEEIPEPSKNIPKALLWTVAIACGTGLATNLAVFFAADDLETTTSILSLLYTVYDNNLTCATVLGSLVAFSVWGSVIGIHTWQSRIVWSLSRDKGFPLHSRMSRLAPAPFHTPAYAICWGGCWISLLGCLYLGSTVAFNSFIGAGIVLQYITYSIPAALLLFKGRGNFPHGSFWWPRFGPIANIVVISWTLLITVFYSFPLFLPVEAASMNYLACVVVFAFLYAGGYWVLYGAKHYRLVDLRILTT